MTSLSAASAVHWPLPENQTNRKYINKLDECNTSNVRWTVIIQKLASSNYSLTVKIYTGTGEWVGLEDAGKTAQHSDDEASP